MDIKIYNIYLYSILALSTVIMIFFSNFKNHPVNYNPKPIVFV